MMQVTHHPALYVLKRQVSEPVKRGPGQPAKYPLSDLEVGESRLFVGVHVNTICKRTSQHKPKKFRCVTVTRKGVVGVRVWRVL